MDEYRRTEPVRTDIHCTECSKNFIAELDFRIDGQHVVECPHCAHEHCRVIKNGIITEERWSSRNGKTIVVNKRKVWKPTNEVLQVQTSSAAHFLRERWLNFDK